MRGRNTWALGIIAVAFAILLAWPSGAGAQTFPQRTPPPPKKNRNFAALTAAPNASSAWQLLTNQPPVLDYTDCGPGNPILLTDGTVLIQDDGCQDWWKLTPDESGSYVNGTWTQVASLDTNRMPTSTSRRLTVKSTRSSVSCGIAPARSIPARVTDA